MKHSKLARFGALVFTLALAAPVAAQDQAPTAERATISATIGYGIFVGDGPDDFNPYGLGLGVRGGYTLDMNLYVGGFFNYFLGESESGGGVDFSANVMPLGVEVGYDIAVSELVIRPSLGLGVAILSASSSGSIGGVSFDESNSETELLLAPGAQLLYPIDDFFVGGEVRYYWIPSEESTDAFLLAANVGMMF